MDIITGLLFLFIGFIIYFIPTSVAQNKEHPQTTAILMLNLFLGWTFIGWVIALVWACTNPEA